MLTGTSHRRSFIAGTLLSAASLFLAVATTKAQTVPIPFAGLLAGGGTVCSASLPVFAVTGTGAKYGDGCPATQATLNTPVSVAVDSYGNVFIADQTYDLVRVVYNGGAALAAAITAANVQNANLVPVKGNIYTIAGGVKSQPTEGTHFCNQSGSGAVGYDTELDGCPGTEAYVAPRGLAVDADGNLFISSVASGSNVHVLYVGGTKAASLITLENPSITTPVVGSIYLIAGSSATSYTGDNALATKATLNTPRGLFIDADENVYFADQLNNVVRRIDSVKGFIMTVAGHCVANGNNCTVTATSGDGSVATAANINSPYGIALDQNGNIFIAEGGSTSSGGRIRVVYEAGTLPGISSPTAGEIYTFAGGLSGTAATETPAQSTAFQFIYGVSIDNSGYIYATDYRSGGSGSNKLWRIDPTNGDIAAIAGNSGTTTLTIGAHCNGGATGPLTADKYGDGCPATQAYLNTPQESLAFTANGTFYIADRSNNLIRSFTYNNSFPSTPVGSGTTQALAFFYPPGSTPTAETFSTAEYTDAGGDTCALNTVLSAATTCVDNIKFMPAAAGQRSANVTVSALSGASATSTAQVLNGIGNSPVLTVDPGTPVALGSNLEPLSISTDLAGNVNISDGNGKQVLRTTIAGGTPTAVITGLGEPQESATDPAGNLFVADSANNNIVELTLSGTKNILGSGLSAPQGVVADLFGNLYIADTGNNRLVYLSPLTGNQITIPLSGFTLNAPTYLARDASGDIYILDSKRTRLLEIPLGAGAQQITLPTGAAPAALDFDPAGNLYLADTTTDDILFVPSGSTTATPLMAGLTTPAGVAIGNMGNLFVADSGSTSPMGYNRRLNTTVFGSTNIQLSSLPSTLTLSNDGDLAAMLATPPYVETGTNATAFPSAGTPTCTAAFVLAPGASCTQAFQFTPTSTAAAQSAKVVFNTTAGQSVTANLSGTATNLIPTTTSLTLVNSGSVNYGQTVTYTVTLTPNSNGNAAPSGNIAFLVDGITEATDTVSSSPYTFNVSLAIGTHSIAAVYSGDSIYAGSNASSSITVGKAITTTTTSYSQTNVGTVLGAIVMPSSTGSSALTGNVLFYIDGAIVATVPVGNGTIGATVLIADGTHTYYATYGGDSNYAASTSTPAQTLIVARAATTTMLTVTPVSTNGAGTLLLTAKVSSIAAGAPSGTVSFSNGSNVLGSVNLSTAVNGAVTFTTSSVLFASYTFAAAYSGDGLFDPSSSTLTEGPDFVVVAPTTTLGVPEGGQSIEAITVTPFNGYTGTLTASCSGLPVNALCRFLPTPLSVTAPTSAALSIQVFAGVNPNVGSLSLPAFVTGSKISLALLLLVPVAFGLRRRTGVVRLLALPLFVLLALGISGCGIKTPGYSASTYSTPVGTTAVTVTLTDANHLSRSAVFNLNVAAQ